MANIYAEQTRSLQQQFLVDMNRHKQLMAANEAEYLATQTSAALKNEPKDSLIDLISILMQIHPAVPKKILFDQVQKFRLIQPNQTLCRCSLESIVYGVSELVILDSTNRRDFTEMRAQVDRLLLEASIQNECVICFEDLIPGSKLNLELDCQHVFHQACLDRWFQEAKSCPSCRTHVKLAVEYPALGPAKK